MSKDVEFEEKGNLKEDTSLESTDNSLKEQRGMKRQRTESADVDLDSCQLEAEIEDILGTALETPMEETIVEGTPMGGTPDEETPMGGTLTQQDNGASETIPTKVYVGKLGDDCTDEDVMELFKPYERHGKITECAIVRDFAFVHFEHEEDAQSAVTELNQTEFQGITITVQLSLKKKKEAVKHCQRCEEDGHWNEDCPKGFKMCYHCQEEGHWYKECPLLNVTPPYSHATGASVESGEPPAKKQKVVRTKLFVGNIPSNTNKEELLAYFEPFGTVVEIAIVRDFAFVHYESEEEAMAAVEALSGERFKGNELDVKLSKSKVKQRPGMEGVQECRGCGGTGHWLDDCPRRSGGRKRSHPYPDWYPERYADPYDDPYDPYSRHRYPPPESSRPFPPGRDLPRERKVAVPTKLFVGGLTDHAKKDELMELFEPFGKVTECDIVRDFAFVHFEHEHDAKAAVEVLNDSEFQGRTLKVKISTSKVRQKPGMEGVVQCRGCGLNGHWFDDCPKKPPNDTRLPPRLPPPLPPLRDPYRDLYRDDPYDDPYYRDRYGLPPLPPRRPLPPLPYPEDPYHNPKRQPPREEGEPIPTKLFVGNLGDDCNNPEFQEELLELFGQFGKVVESDTIRDFAFVHYQNKDEAQAAVDALNDTEFRGKKIRVKVSTSKMRQKPGMGGVKSCNHCGREGHWARECTSLTDEGYGREYGEKQPIVPCKLFVGHLPEDCKSSELRTEMEKYGIVEECDIIKDYAFVHFKHESDAKEAIRALNGNEFKGSKLKVQLSSSKMRQKPGMRGVAECKVCGQVGHWHQDCPNADPGARRPFSDPLRRDPYSRYNRDPYADRLRDPYPERLRDPYDRLRDPYRDPYERLRDPYDHLRDPYERLRDPYDHLRDPYDRLRDPYRRAPYPDPYARERGPERGLERGPERDLFPRQPPPPPRPEGAGDKYPDFR